VGEGLGVLVGLGDTLGDGLGETLGVGDGDGLGEGDGWIVGGGALSGETSRLAAITPNEPAAPSSSAATRTTAIA
jgi:hypothetical protein